MTQLIKKRQVIYEFLERFINVFRDEMTANANIQQYIPNIFKYHYHHMIFNCIDGNIVASYPAMLGDYYFEIPYEGSVLDCIKTLPNQAVGIKEHFGLIIDNVSNPEDQLIFAIIDRVETSNGPIPTTGWKFLHIGFGHYNWPLEKANQEANELLDSFRASQKLFKVRDNGFVANFDSSVFRLELISKLNKILKDYESTLDEKSFSEKVIHKYINENHILLYPNKSELRYEVPLKGGNKIKYIADFVIRIRENNYIFVELENPKHKLFTQGNDFTKYVKHAEKQVEDWLLLIRENINDLRKEFPDILTPEGLIVMGRNIDLSEDQKKSIQIRNENSRIKLLTYDDLAEDARNHIEHLLRI